MRATKLGVKNPNWALFNASVAAARLSFASAQLSRLGDPSGLKAELSRQSLAQLDWLQLSSSLATACSQIWKE